MSNVGISARRVSKRFHRGELHDSLRDLLPALTRRIVNGRAHAAKQGDFWALRNVNFDVEPGDALGIIGPNGAGKSTLLKLITRILRPTDGHIVVRGRMGSLIEVAGGFHPDLTGRENIQLQGAIMGMRRAQIRARFDEIVEFSGISDFIDTPVKRYSSGMNARLGFSIAAHLEPDVLVIDEVLAVGDYSFQRRAFQRIQDLVTTRHTPVVVVSHQLDRVASLCTRVILLNRGTVVREGSPEECISAYIQSEHNDQDTGESWDVPVRIQNAEAVSALPVASGGVLSLRVRASTMAEFEPDSCALGIRVRGLHNGQIMFIADTKDLGIEMPAGEDFNLNLQLQLNVPPALYSAEVIVRDYKRRRVVVGPALTVMVKGGPGFAGAVQMNAQGHLADAQTRCSA